MATSPTRRSPSRAPTSVATGSRRTYSSATGWITFTGWRYALEEYAAALEDAGLLLERLREPAAPPAAAASRPSSQRWQRLPMFLHFRAVKR